MTLESSLGNTVAGTFNDGPGTQATEWYGYPRTDSPINYCDPVPGSGVSTHGELGVKNGSLHSLGR